MFNFDQILALPKVKQEEEKKRRRQELIAFDKKEDTQQKEITEEKVEILELYQRIKRQEEVATEATEMLTDIDTQDFDPFLKKHLPGIAMGNLGASEAEAKAYLKALIPYWKQEAVTERYQEDLLTMVLEENFSQALESKSKTKQNIAPLVKELKDKLKQEKVEMSEIQELADENDLLEWEVLEELIKDDQNLKKIYAKKLREAKKNNASLKTGQLKILAGYEALEEYQKSLGISSAPPAAPQTPAQAPTQQNIIPTITLNPAPKQPPIPPTPAATPPLAPNPILQTPTQQTIVPTIPAKQPLAPKQQPLNPAQQPPVPSNVPDAAQLKQEQIADSVINLNKLFLRFAVSYITLEAEAKKISATLSELAIRFIESVPELKTEYEQNLALLPADQQDDETIEELAVSLILEQEKANLEKELETLNDTIKDKDREILKETDDQERSFLKDERERLENERNRLEILSKLIANDLEKFVTASQKPQPPGNLPVAPITASVGQPAQMPTISPDQLDAAQLAEEIKKIHADFEIHIQSDQIASEPNNRAILETVREALQGVDHKKLSGQIKTISLVAGSSRISPSGENILLQYDLSAQEMTEALIDLEPQLIEKQNEMFKAKYDIEPEYYEIFQNALIQMNQQNVPKEAQDNFFKLLEKVVKSDDLDDSNKEKLELIKFVFMADKNVQSPREIESVEIGDYDKHEINIALGNKNINNIFSIDDMADGFIGLVRDL